MLVNKARARGFTLIELMTTVTILTVLTLAAAPAFREFIANQRVRNATFDLVSALTLARSQAITQNGAVSLKKAGDTWSAGWKVTDDTNVFGSKEALPSLDISTSGNATLVTFDRDGRLSSSSTQFTIKPSVAVSGVSPRCVKIDLSGRPAAKQGECS